MKIFYSRGFSSKFTCLFFCHFCFVCIWTSFVVSRIFGFGQNTRSQRATGRLAKTHSRMAWRRGYAISCSWLDGVWEQSQESISEYFFFLKTKQNSTHSEYIIRLLVLGKISQSGFCASLPRKGTVCAIENCSHFLLQMAHDYQGAGDRDVDSGTRVIHNLSSGQAETCRRVVQCELWTVN